MSERFVTPDIDHAVVVRFRGVAGIYPTREHAQRAASSYSGAYPDREVSVVVATAAHHRELAAKVRACVQWELDAR